MRVLLMLAVLVLISTFLASAANDTPLTQIFTGNGSSIMPPSFGEAVSHGNGNATLAVEKSGGAPGQLATVASGQLAAAPAAYDSRALITNLVLDIIDANTGQPITNAHIRVTMGNGQTETDTLRFVGDNGKMELQLAPGQWTITLKLDIISTVGKDYYYSFNVDLESDKNMTAYLQPVGSLRGEVLDMSNNLLPGATVKFECAGDYGVIGPMTTDNFGSFTADWLPVGSCKVSAMSGSKAGSMTVQIAQGQLSEVRITLEQNVAATGNSYVWIFAVVIIAVSIAVFLMMKRKPKIKPKDDTSAAITPDGHMESILSALDENEKRIVESLMASGGKSMQNKLARELSLPKSSLSRAISGLEARELVKTERLGRIRRVELSSWFLNGKKA